MVRRACVALVKGLVQSAIDTWQNTAFALATTALVAGLAMLANLIFAGRVI